MAKMLKITLTKSLIGSTPYQKKVVEALGLRKKPQPQVEHVQVESEETTSEMIAGKNPVLEALRSGREINKLWIAEGVKKSGVQELIELAKEIMRSMYHY